MFGSEPWRICPFDETTHRPGRAVPSAGTIKQPQITELTERAVTVPGPPDTSQIRRMTPLPDRQSINEQIGGCQSDIHREVGSV